MGKRALSGQPRWPRMLLGSVLLWRTLSVAAPTPSADLVDPLFLAEWSSPGLNRSVKLTFRSYGSDAADANSLNIDIEDTDGLSKPRWRATWTHLSGDGL